ncbi:hypothetical protein LINPERHAP2_LOCUS33484 [Linum perenne]
MVTRSRVSTARMSEKATASSRSVLARTTRSKASPGRFGGVPREVWRRPQCLHRVGFGSLERKMKKKKKKKRGLGVEDDEEEEEDEEEERFGRLERKIKKKKKKKRGTSSTCMKYAEMWR